MSNQTESSSGESVIEISNVWKIFGTEADAALRAIREEGLGKAEVLETYNAVVGVADVSLDVRKGEIFCVMGLSGSGKSTLVRHFNRLLEPTAGKIVIHGTDVMGLGTQDLMEFRNRKIGMVFQNFALLPHRSVLDNVAMPLEIRNMNKNERMRRAANMLKTVELDAWGNKYAHELSGGMQQRVGLARALAADPDVLLMDEPFSALDPLIRRQLQDEFIKLSAVMKKTTMFITHDLDEAVRIGDRIAIMRDGRVVQIGTAEDIVMHPADDYVADFVAGISRLKIVRAHAVMQPLEKYVAKMGQPSDDAPRVNENESLSTLI
ncbi:MAG: betaine/proline/choline family ABC transporter ATP-binding protein, partial [Gammaproteobacteria bacterium]|nr:betaine/proline/choline family ABC transporter ATP-binding protein [Gammaproteobacteria bacterium]